MLVLGDDREATDLVQALADAIPGMRGVYGGRLRNAHQVEALTANLIAVNRRYKATRGSGHRRLRNATTPGGVATGRGPDDDDPRAGRRRLPSGVAAAGPPLRTRRHGLLVRRDRAAADGARPRASASATAAWSISLYVLMLAVTTAVYGRVSDLVGVRLPLVFGITLMTVGAIAAALAPTFEVLLVARLFQGAGAAAVPTLGVAALSARYDGSVRGLALGRLAGVAAAVSCLGPLVGGLVEHSLGWRAVMALPILGVAVIPFLWRALAGGGTGARLDIVGAVLVARSPRAGWCCSCSRPTSGLTIAVVGALLLLLGAPARGAAGAPPAARLPADVGDPQRRGGALGGRRGVDARRRGSRC